MLATFFSKSKPINYIIIALYMLILFCIAYYRKGFDMQSYDIILFLAGVVLYILPMLLLHFITQRNDLTYKGTYTILLYAFFTGLLTNSLTNIGVLLSSAFVLFGLQNVLRIRNGKHVKAKIFNASLCIGIASLGCFWSIGFIVMVFLAISFFEPKNYRNWIIPIIGLMTVYLFANCFTLLVYDSFFGIGDYFDPISFSFQNYLVKDKLFSVGILAICIFFFLSLYMVKFRRKTANTKPVLRLIIAYLFIGIGVALLSPEKDTSELFFITAPLAIIGTTYLEMDYHKFAKEINIWVFMLIPFTILLF